MKKIYLIAAISAILCGLLVYQYLGSLERTAASNANSDEMVSVVVATQDIESGAEIASDMVTMADYPKAYVHAQAAYKTEDIVGKRANGKILAGEIILKGIVGSADEVGASLSKQVTTGMRAMTVNVDAYSGVGGYIEEGDRVDVLSYNDGKSTVVLQDVQVMKLGEKSSSDDGTTYTGVTLLVPKDNCTDVLKAQKGGSIYLVLRDSLENNQ